MSRYKVSPATIHDLPSIATISRASFRNSPNTISHWLFPQDNEDGVYSWRLQGMVKRFNNDATTFYVKCVDTANDQIVSFALWQQPHATETEEEKAKKMAEQREKADELPKGTNKALMVDFESATEEMRRKYVDAEKDYVLTAISTLPEYQGQGCGSMLIKSGLETIDAQKAKVFLEATPQGRPLYEIYGWKFVDEMTFDLDDYGCSGVQKVTCMMRDAVE